MCKRLMALFLSAMLIASACITAMAEGYIDNNTGVQDSLEDELEDTMYDTDLGNDSG